MATKPLNGVIRNIKSFVAARATADASDAELLGRFVAERDEAAFTVLVKRHGRMVLDVGRRALGRDQDAEDVFQATFLLLARKAGSIRKRGSVASWLYGTAYRLSKRARAQRALRSAREATAAKIHQPHNRVTTSWDELQEVLQDVLARLPEKYRTPLVLCYLEGKTQEQAARQLACPLGTVRSWLARGRVLLRKRLARRGIALSVSALASALIARAASAGELAAPLAQPIVKAALRFAAGTDAVNLVSGKAAGLINLSLAAVTAAKLKLVAALAMALVLLAVGASAWSGAFLGSTPDPSETPGILGERADGGAADAHRTERPADKSQAAEQRPDGVDQFGDPLPEGAIARLGTVRFRHGGTVSCVAFSPDSKTLASAGYDHLVRLWDPATGKEIRRFVGHRDLVMDIAFSPDGRRLASASYEGDRTVRVWEVATGRQLRSFDDGGGHWGHVAFSPDGKLVAGGNSAHVICLWDVEKGKLLHRLDGQERSPVAVCVAFSPDGRLLASGGKDGAIRLWDPATGKELRRFQGAAKDWNHDVVFSPDGRVLASCGMEGKKGMIHLWDVAKGREIQRFPAHEGSFRLSYSSDGKMLAYMSYDNELRSVAVYRLDAKTGKKLQVLPAATSGLAGSCALAPDNRSLAWSVGSALHVLDLQRGQEKAAASASSSTLYHLTFSPDRRFVLSTSFADAKPLRLWDWKTGKAVGQPFGNGSDRIAAVLPGHKVVSCGGGNDMFRIWDPASGKETGRFGKLDSKADFLVSGKVLISGSSEGVISLWQTETGKEGWRVNAVGLLGLALSPDGKTVMSFHPGQNVIRCWDESTGKEMRPIPVPASFKMIQARSPDGRFWAVSDAPQMLLNTQEFDETVWLLDVSTGKSRLLLHEKLPAFQTMAFSPDGRTLATGASGKQRIYGIRLWEVATGQERCRLNGHQGPISSLVFSPDGKYLISGSWDATGLVWDLSGRSRRDGSDARPLSTKELDECWLDLAATDARRAYRSILKLAAHPVQAVEYLRARLQPVRAADPKKSAALLLDLDNADFQRRERATRELEQLGAAVIPALKSMLSKGSSLEVCRRIESLLAKIQGAPELRHVRAVETLERLGTMRAARLLRELSQGLDGARLTQEAKASLERLARRAESPGD